MIKLAILFTQSPFNSATSREGLDALLAASAFCNEDEILIAFINDGVFNLKKAQQPDSILQKDHISTFKLIELYELNECLVCQESLQERQMQRSDLILSNVTLLHHADILTKIKTAPKLLTF